MWYQIGFTVLLALSLAFCAFTLAIVSSGYQHRLVRGLVLVTALLNLTGLCLIVFTRFNPCGESPVTDEAVQELADASLAVSPVTGPQSLTPSGESSMAEDEEASEFGGIHISNPSKHAFSVMMLDPDTGEYHKYIMTNKHNEEVTTSWDEKYALDADDAETYFEGYVLVGETKYKFVFDSEANGKSVKELKI